MKRGYDRKTRVGDEIQKVLAKFILQDMPPRFRFVTITDVTMSRDLAYAKVFVSVLNDDPEEIKKILEDLNKEAKSIRYNLAKQVKLRIVPELRFVYDESTAHGFKISTLINSAMKKTDKNK